MSVFQTGFERSDRAKSTRAAWVFTAKLLFALTLLLAATLALAETELLVAHAHQVSDAELRLILPP